MDTKLQRICIKIEASKKSNSPELRGIKNK
jgi:hypothetical protein